MYPYHNKIKSRINNNELLHYEYVPQYKNISPCLLLHFRTEPFIRGIRGIFSRKGAGCVAVSIHLIVTESHWQPKSVCCACAITGKMSDCIERTLRFERYL